MTHPLFRRPSQRVLASAVFLGMMLWFGFGRYGMSNSAIHSWNWYHYLLGSRYYTELGYSDLYEQSVVAQRESGGPLARISRVRDLHSYRIRPVDGDWRRSPAFSEERWQDFRSDLDAMVGQMSPATQRGALLDRGYNATPFWDALFRPATSWVDPSKPLHRYLVKTWDPLLLLFGVLMIAWLLDWRWAALAALAVFLFPTSPTRYLGGTLKYDWLVLLLLVPPLLRRKHFAMGGGLIGMAACMRVFPAVLMLGPGVAILSGLLARRVPREALKTLAGFVVAVAIGLGVGAAPAGHMQRWKDFASVITQHNHEMVVGNGRVGLDHLLTVSFPLGKRSTLSARSQNLEGRGTFRNGLRGLLLLTLLWALWRSTLHDGVILSTVALFALTVASHYYWTLVAMWVFLSGRREEAPGWGGPALALGTSACWWLGRLFLHKDYPRWLLFDSVLLLGLLLVLAQRIWAQRRPTQVLLPPS